MADRADAGTGGWQYPTDPFLVELSRRARRFRESHVAMPPDDFLQLETVRKYAASIDDLEDHEQLRRLTTLGEFATFVGQTPDEMVELIFNRETHKYRKRGFYTEKVKEFSLLLAGPAHLQLARGNVVRSFFIANGYRLVPERPSWM